MKTELPDAIQNVHLQLDSETARYIADQWITYKYIYAIMEFTTIMVALGGIIFGVVWFVRRGIKNEERRRAERG